MTKRIERSWQYPMKALVHSIRLYRKRALRVEPFMMMMMMIVMKIMMMVMVMIMMVTLLDNLYIYVIW